MKPLEQEIRYSHGTPFIVRRVRSGHAYARNYRRQRYDNWVMTAEAGYVIFTMQGKFLCRVRRNLLRRWLNHFGLEFLKCSKRS